MARGHLSGRVLGGLVAFGLIGALTTAAIALSLSLFAVRNAQGRDLPKRWPIAVPDNWPREPSYATVWTESVAGGRVRWKTGWYAFWDESGVYEANRVTVGWPWRAFTGDVLTSPEGESRWGAFTLTSKRGVTYIPLWPGFALDTAFYGTLAFLLWSAPGFVRRTRRRRRGLCVACGYELKGMQKCPECGL